MKSPVVKRSIVIAGHKTSVSLEDAFWKGLKEIATSRDLTLSDLVALIDDYFIEITLTTVLAYGAYAGQYGLIVSTGGNFTVFFDGDDPGAGVPPKGVRVRFSAPLSTDDAILRQAEGVRAPGESACWSMDWMAGPFGSWTEAPPGVVQLVT